MDVISKDSMGMQLAYGSMLIRKDLFGDKSKPIPYETFKTILSENKVVNDEYVKEEITGVKINNKNSQDFEVAKSSEKYMKLAYNLEIINEENFLISENYYQDLISKKYEENNKKDTTISSTPLNLKA